MRPILLPIAPRWAELILRGAKTAEIRRRIPADGAAGRTAALYATSPVSAVVGQVRVHAELSGRRTALWAALLDAGEETCLTLREYAAYTRGADRVHALLIDRAVAHPPLRLPGPAPRSWRWLTDREAAALAAWAEAP